jgi:hypothetical protein
LIVNEFQDHRADESIPNDRFEYQSPGSNMLIAIDAQAHQQITWRRLFQVLQALQGFMTAIRPYQKPYYHSLTFEIGLTDKSGVVGNGLVWFLPSGSDQVQKRAVAVAPSSSANGTSLQLNSPTNVSLGASANKDILYHVARRCLTLDYYYIEGLLSCDEIVVAVQGAMANIAPNATGPYKDDAVPSDRFRWVEPDGVGPNTRVAVTILLSDGHDLSWKQLYDMLYGLYQYATGMNGRRPHCEPLGFRIVRDTEGGIGVGTLLYFEPEPNEVQRRAETASETIGDSAMIQARVVTIHSKSYSPNGTLHSPQNQDGTPIVSGPKRKFTAWPVPGTDIEFTFTIVGIPIVPRDLFNLLRTAQAQIAAAVRTQPAHRIPNNHFRYINHEHSLAIHILAYENKAITWLELGSILSGLSLFCAQGPTRGLVFEIDIFGHRIGFGILQPPPDSLGATAMTKRAFMPTLPLPSPTIASACASYPVPGTPMTLDISPFGHTDSSLAEISAALTGALRKIYPHLAREGGQAIPDNRWSYGDVMTDVWLSVVVWIGRTLSWQQLSWVVSGLLQWMTSPGRSSTKTVLVDFSLEGEGSIGIGALRTQGLPTGFANGTAKVMANEIAKSCASDIERRSITANKTVPLPYRKTMTSALQGKDETLPVPWPIPGSQLTLQFTYLEGEVPDFGLYATRMINSARATIQIFLQFFPHQPLTGGYFLYRKDFTPSLQKVCITIHESSSHIITWAQLDVVLAALSLFMLGVPTNQALQFDIDQSNVGKIGFGTIACGHLVCGERLTNAERRTAPSADSSITSLATNAILQQSDLMNASSASSIASRVITLRPTNTTTLGHRLDPFRVPNTRIVLNFNTLPTPIPAARVADLWTGAQNAIAAHVGIQPNDPISPSSFFYQLGYSGSREIISFVINPEPNHQLTWLQLQQIMLGVQIVMTGRGTASHMLALDIAVDILGLGRAANGLLRYTKSDNRTSYATDK